MRVRGAGVVLSANLFKLEHLRMRKVIPLP